MYKIVFIRHGQSVWNLENRFTGWADVDLTPTGVQQARSAGMVLKQHGFDFDIAYTSMLQRATRTLWHCLDEMQRTWLPVVHAWRLNERHYGALQGLNKLDTAKHYGEAQVMAWRRSYDVPPPALDPSDPRCERGDLRDTIRSQPTESSGGGRRKRFPVCFKRVRRPLLRTALVNRFPGLTNTRSQTFPKC